MKQFYCALVVGLGFAAANANAACDYPTAPGKFPDGATAPIADLKAAKAEVEKYNADIDTYLACLTHHLQRGHHVVAVVLALDHDQVAAANALDPHPIGGKLAVAGAVLAEREQRGVFVGRNNLGGGVHGGPVTMLEQL